MPENMLSSLLLETSPTFLLLSEAEMLNSLDAMLKKIHITRPKIQEEFP